MRFFTGLHQPSDARHFDAAFISVNRLRTRRRHFIVGDWIMDSGAFTEISTHGRYRSSVAEYAMILEAVAATLAIWPVPPDQGLVTFVDPAKVRRKRDPGRCYLRAGFRRVGTTRSGLIVLQLLPQLMPAPVPAIGTQRAMEYAE